MKAVLSGLDVLIRENLAPLHAKPLALLANQASVSSSLDHLFDILKEHPKITLKRVFAPEHGFRGVCQDMETVGDEVHEDSGSQIDIVSLYGSTADELYPKKSDLDDIEVLLVDLPDIGARYYTFAQTMAYCMQVAAKTNTKVIVLDRPNPISGSVVEGSPLEPGYESFCGYAAIAQRHGLTLGELALLFNQGCTVRHQGVKYPIDAIQCDLEVVRMESWKREMYFDQCGLPWVLPSVNMPTLDTAIVYPGMCFFEATRVSEARGTTRPFEFVGAPYIDGRTIIKALARSELTLEGAKLREIEFIPKFQKHAETRCGGVQIHVHNRDTFAPLLWAIALLKAIKVSYPNDFAWRADAYEFIDTVPAIDLLYGSSRLREAIEQGSELSAIEDEITSFSAAFEEARQGALLYSN